MYERYKRKHKFSSLVKTKKTKSVTKLIDETQEYRKQNREERNPPKLATQQTQILIKKIRLCLQLQQ